MSSQLNAPTSPHAPQADFPRGPDISRDYGVTRLVLMPRDPQWMHAYWEVASYTWEEAGRNFGSGVRAGRPVLRFYSAGPDGAKRSFDVEVQLDARNWYVMSPGR